MFLHRGEIPAVVKQRAATLDGESVDDDIGRLADRNTQFSQPAPIPGCAEGKFGIRQQHEDIPAQSAFNERGVRIIPGALTSSAILLCSRFQTHPPCRWRSRQSE